MEVDKSKIYNEFSTVFPWPSENRRDELETGKISFIYRVDEEKQTLFVRSGYYESEKCSFNNKKND